MPQLGVKSFRARKPGVMVKNTQKRSLISKFGIRLISVAVIFQAPPAHCQTGWHRRRAVICARPRQLGDIQTTFRRYAQPNDQTHTHHLPCSLRLIRNEHILDTTIIIARINIIPRSSHAVSLGNQHQMHMSLLLPTPNANSVPAYLRYARLVCRRRLCKQILIENRNSDASAHSSTVIVYSGEQTTRHADEVTRRDSGKTIVRVPDRSRVHNTEFGSILSATRC